MLSNLSEDVAECYRHAAECQELARLVTNERDRQFFLASEKDWLLLAQTHQLAEGMGRAIDDLVKRSGATLTRSCPACKTVTPIHYNTVFVCTNCNLVFEDQ